jgi:hypothetical protein
MTERILYQIGELRVVMSKINQPSAFVRFRLFNLAEFTFKPCLLDQYQLFPHLTQVFWIFIPGLISTGSQIKCLERKQRAKGMLSFVQVSFFLNKFTLPSSTQLHKFVQTYKLLLSSDSCV